MRHHVTPLTPRVHRTDWSLVATDAVGIGLATVGCLAFLAALACLGAPRSTFVAWTLSAALCLGTGWSVLGRRATDG